MNINTCVCCKNTVTDWNEHILTCNESPAVKEINRLKEELQSLKNRSAVTVVLDKTIIDKVIDNDPAIHTVLSKGALNYIRDKHVRAPLTTDVQQLLSRYTASIRNEVVNILNSLGVSLSYDGSIQKLTTQFKKELSDTVKKEISTICFDAIKESTSEINARLENLVQEWDNSWNAYIEKKVEFYTNENNIETVIAKVISEKLKK